MVQRGAGVDCLLQGWAGASLREVVEGAGGGAGVAGAVSAADVALPGGVGDACPGAGAGLGESGGLVAMVFGGETVAFVCGFGAPVSRVIQLGGGS